MGPTINTARHIECSYDNREGGGGEQELANSQSREFIE